MIKAENGVVEYKGTGADIITDYILITKKLRGLMTKSVGEKAADEMIDSAYKTAKMSVDDLETRANQIILAKHILSMTEEEREKLRKEIER